MSASTLDTNFPSLVLLKQKSNLITSSGSTPSMTPHCPYRKISYLYLHDIALNLFSELLIHPSCILAPATLNSLHTWAFYTTPAELPFPCTSLWLTSFRHLLSEKICTRGPSLSPGHRPIAVWGLLGTWPHSRMGAEGEPVKLHLYSQPLQITGITAWGPPPVRSVVALDSPRSKKPTVNYTHERSRLSTPYENHPETIPPPSHERIVFHNTSPWCQNGWGRGLLPHQYNMKISQWQHHRSVLLSHA